MVKDSELSDAWRVDEKDDRQGCRKVVVTMKSGKIIAYNMDS